MLPAVTPCATIRRPELSGLSTLSPYAYLISTNKLDYTNGPIECNNDLVTITIVYALLLGLCFVAGVCVLTTKIADGHVAYFG